MLTPRGREKLVRLLALAGSDRDGEALAAVRKAAKVLADEGLTWETAIVSAARPAPRPVHDHRNDAARYQQDPFGDLMRWRNAQTRNRQDTDPFPFNRTYWWDGRSGYTSTYQQYARSAGKAEQMLRDAEARSLLQQVGDRMVPREHADRVIKLDGQGTGYTDDDIEFLRMVLEASRPETYEEFQRRTGGANG